jgi:DNA-directed RNA polymerase subunit RPC12/RpoP
MEYTCIYCRKPFNINPAEAAGAVIDYTFGKKTHNFKCDNCGKDNALTKAQYEAAKIAAENPTPVAGAGTKPVAKPASQPSPLMTPVGGVKPVGAPAPKPVTSAPAPVAPPMTKREATKKTKEDNARRRGEDVSKGSKRNKSDARNRKKK